MEHCVIARTYRPSEGHIIDAHTTHPATLKRLQEMVQSSQRSTPAEYIATPAPQPKPVLRYTEAEQLQILHDFYHTLAAGMEDCPPEFVNMVDEEFWDLV